MRGADGYWVDAADLLTGDRLLNDDGSWAEVVSSEVIPEPLQAYNLTVESWHTYFVAANEDAAPVWVHNDCFPDLTEFRKTHILNRHKFGTGISGKTEFPSGWGDQKILTEISDVATDPSLTRIQDRYGSQVIGFRDGIEIRIDFYPDNHSGYPGWISTGYPLNTPTNR